MSQSSLGHTPTGERWEFDTSVTAVFDDMLKRSIPQYDVMRHAVAGLAMRYVKPNTHVLDLGCSLGESLAPLVDRFGGDCRYLGVEVSGPMLDAARNRFKPLIDAGSVEILDLDLRTGFPRVSASVILSVLTIQFTPIAFLSAGVQAHRHRRLLFGLQPDPVRVGLGAPRATAGRAGPHAEILPGAPRALPLSRRRRRAVRSRREDWGSAPDPWRQAVGA